MHMRRRAGRVAAARVKVAAAGALTGAAMAAATAVAISHGTAGRPETTLASAASVGRERAEPALRVLSISPGNSADPAGGWSTLRLEQLLAQLGYLPLTWIPDNDSGLHAAPGSGPVTVSYSQRHGPVVTSTGGAVVTNTGGGFGWRGSYPPALTSLWQPGQPGVILTGALMAFQADHGLPMTATITRRLWRALLRAMARGERNPHGYSYALADQARPETLTVWHDGQLVVRGLASTGTADTPTVLGTFPVYLRNRFQVMRGLMPDGSPYADPVQFVSYFHGDYAVHSMNRPSFGWPQSLGCVELPLSVARQVWQYLTYGSLVTVTD
jgi:peptidoglycan hydrolase-like protein with peptidoglycan-binding domain